MQITYDSVADLLYLRFDERAQPLVNRRIAEDLVLDVGKGERIVGLEIMNASRRLRLEKLLPIEQRVQRKAALGTVRTLWRRSSSNCTFAVR